MPAAILLSVDKKSVSVAPGASAELVVTAQNLTTLLDQVALRLEGIDRGWVEFVPGYLPVFAQGQAAARAIISPPAEPAQALAGRYELQVRGTLQEHPGEEGAAGSQLELQLVGDYRITLERGEARGPQQGTFAVQLQNGANAPLSLRLAGQDAGQVLWYKFDPFQVTVPAGGSASAILTVRARQTADQERTIPFTLSAQGEYGLRGGGQVPAPERQVMGRFLQTPAGGLSVAIDPPQAEPTAANAAVGSAFTIRVGNPGTEQLQAVLSAAGEGLAFGFEPEQLTLPPQSEVRSRLQVSVQAPAAVDGPLPFQVTATPAGGAATPGTARGALLRKAAPAPPLPQPFPWWIVAIGLLTVLVLTAILLLALR